MAAYTRCTHCACPGLVGMCLLAIMGKTRGNVLTHHLSKTRGNVLTHHLGKTRGNVLTHHLGLTCGNVLTYHLGKTRGKVPTCQWVHCVCPGLVGMCLLTIWVCCTYQHLRCTPGAHSIIMDKVPLKRPCLKDLGSGFVPVPGPIRSYLL
ncbi:hypothetical protein EDB92DRAFT_1818291 [Lactarius akahatsu]|uniref:Uncharacterized protein n=1 Tax=Lactarius akahatsu TaxID=416441 RepID=A0AAD4LFF3_9AGAM|nr:hypothetical protein EDB92DRAFT_1818291 [Lactarius akahatsu]